jgi:hypothetical protein
VGIVGFAADEGAEVPGQKFGISVRLAYNAGIVGQVWMEVWKILPKRTANGPRGDWRGMSIIAWAIT